MEAGVTPTGVSAQVLKNPKVPPLAPWTLRRFRDFFLFFWKITRWDVEVVVVDNGRLKFDSPLHVARHFLEG